MPTDNNEPPQLEDVYDDRTLAGIDRRQEPSRAHPPPATPATLGSRVASGALAAGLMRGVADALEVDNETDAVVDVLDEDRSTKLEPVTVVLVPGIPSASMAIVRPWLFPIKR